METTENIGEVKVPDAANLETPSPDEQTPVVDESSRNAEEVESDQTGAQVLPEAQTLADVPRRNLMDIIAERQAAEPKDVPTDEKVPDDTPEPEQVEKPEETAEETEKSEEKPLEQAEKPEDADESDEDIDKKFSHESPKAREEIKRQRAEIRELKSRLAQNDAVPEELKDFQWMSEQVGGREGLEELTKKIEVLENPESGDDFLKIIENSPHKDVVADKFFWEQLDNEENQEIIVRDQFGEDYSLERLRKLVAADKKGLINLYELELREQNPLISEDEISEEVKKETEAQKRLREIEEKETREKQEKEAENSAKELTGRWDKIAADYDKDLFLEMERLGFLPNKGDSEEVAQTRFRFFQTVLLKSHDEFQQNPVYQQLSKFVERGDMESFTFKNKARVFGKIYLDVIKRNAVSELPFLKGTLNVLGGATVAKNNQPKKPTPGAENSSLKVSEPVDEPKKPTVTDRKNAFQEAAEKNAQRRNIQERRA